MNGLVQPSFLQHFRSIEHEQLFAEAVDSKIEDFKEDGILFGYVNDYTEDDIDEMFFESHEYNNWRIERTEARQYKDLKRLGRQYRHIKEKHREYAIEQIAEGIVRGEL